jgi:hypothetical protein
VGRAGFLGKLSPAGRLELLKAFEIERKAPEPADNYARWDFIIYDGIK